jgi:hypothetical protein
MKWVIPARCKKTEIVGLENLGLSNVGVEVGRYYKYRHQYIIPG